jgi:DNA polymerase-3 subunit epsilon
MREIVLDTETTGLDPEDGHRIVEIGAVELENALPTGRAYHQYINPERPMPLEAYNVHGLGDAFLRTQPVFVQVVDAFLEFIGAAPLVIHNAAFDMAMINAELARAGRPTLPAARAVDTLEIAKRAFPGAPVSLDALCKRFSVDNSGRDKHGALLDTELLAEVYLALQGGRQRGRALEGGPVPSGGNGSARRTDDDDAARVRPHALPPRLTDAERAAHAAFVAELGDTPLWAAGSRREG